MGRSAINLVRLGVVAAAVVATEAVAAPPPAAVPATNPDWHKLDVGVINTAGIVFSSAVSGENFRYVTGQTFTPTSAIDCTDFSPASSEYATAVKRGAKIVKINVEGTKAPYYGVLAFCQIYKTAVGPASRSYSVQVPAEYLTRAKGGLVSVVGEKVAVTRSTWDSPTHAKIKFGDIFKRSTTPMPQYGEVTEDFSWILWLTDRGPTFTEAATAPGQ